MRAIPGRTNPPEGARLTGDHKPNKPPEGARHAGDRRGEMRTCQPAWQTVASKTGRSPQVGIAGMARSYRSIRANPCTRNTAEGGLGTRYPGGT